MPEQRCGVMNPLSSGNPATNSVERGTRHGHHAPVMASTERRRRVLLDDVSKRIIEQLQEDGRRSYAAIGKAVGLSEAAVRQRVQRLIEEGVMQIVAVTDPLSLGAKREAMIGIKVEGDLEEVAARLGELSESEYVVICAGSFDILAEVLCEDDEHLLALVNERIRRIPGVRGTETFVYLRLAKQTYAWGPL